ncbi:Uncharacterised protein [Mycobacteroides abscessus subsp. abscessus]|nr:Uncharacterised protein [Mycobacteroides abscessus subsp. abscessus]
MSESPSPASIRASSATRSSSSRRRTPLPLLFTRSTVRWISAKAATCGRWVTTMT